MQLPSTTNEKEGDLLIDKKNEIPGCGPVVIAASVNVRPPGRRTAWRRQKRRIWNWIIKFCISVFLNALMLNSINPTSSSHHVVNCTLVMLANAKFLSFYCKTYGTHYSEYWLQPVASWQLYTASYSLLVWLYPGPHRRSYSTGLRGPTSKGDEKWREKGEEGNERDGRHHPLAQIPGSALQLMLLCAANMSVHKVFGRSHLADTQVDFRVAWVPLRCRSARPACKPRTVESALDVAVSSWSAPPPENLSDPSCLRPNACRRWSLHASVDVMNKEPTDEYWQLTPTMLCKPLTHTCLCRQTVHLATSLQEMRRNFCLSAAAWRHGFLN